MICTACRTFLGNPCSACRTASRIRFYLESGNIPVGKEGEVLTALRSAAGVLSDIVEQYGFRARLPAAPELGAAGSDGGSAPLSEASKKEEQGTPSYKKLTEEDQEGPVKAESKESKKEKSKKKSKSGGEETPGGSKDKTRKERREEDRIIKKHKREPEDSDHRTKSPSQHLQEQVDRYVTSHPDSFGLGSIPVRGSAGRHFAEQETRRRRERPPEPVGPPPQRPRGGRSERDRSKSRKGKKKSKGARHRERGRLYWQGVHRKERCLQRQR